MQPRSLKDGSYSVEDNLLDLLALIKFGLHQVEHADAEGFAAMKSEWCTMMYLLQEKAREAYDTAGHMTLMSLYEEASHERTH